jgi:hypothetical protein
VIFWGTGITVPRTSNVSVTGDGEILVDEQSIFYKPHLGASTEEEAAILARVYRLVLDAHARRRAATWATGWRAMLR